MTRIRSDHWAAGRFSAARREMAAARTKKRTAQSR
jgi:hypothetical protein